MKVRELIEELEECMDDTAEVVLMSQPDRHPLYYYLRSSIDIRDVGSKCFIILEEGSQIGYSLGE